MENAAIPKWRKALSTSALIIVLIVLAFEITQIPWPLPTWRHKLLRAVLQIEGGIRFYEMEYGALPPATDNAGVIKILAGYNPRKIKFADFDPAQLNSRGELLDPWGTPYQISLDADTNIHITSAGPDQKFETKDDIRIVDSVKNCLP